MNPTEKVITEPQAKRLKELGFKEKSQWFWKKISGRKPVLIQENEIDVNISVNIGIAYYPAYDVAEMMEIMEIDIETSRVFNNKYVIEILGRHPFNPEDTLAEALGELLIYLLENDKLK